MIRRPETLEKLLEIFRSFPAVGPKMSERIAFYLLRSGEDKIKEVLKTIEEAYYKVRPCSICGYWDDISPCRICQDSDRDQSLLCVVESPQDLVAMSRVKNFRGLYHVLGGALSPLEGVGPKDLRIDLLLKRLEEGHFREVLLALNPDIEGETTVQYLVQQIQFISKKLREQGSNGNRSEIKVTRLAQGLPAGGELEYMDETTLLRAFDGRKSLIAEDSPQLTSQK
ncbi:MAG: recombination protein RecR [Elusimicrobia bacterium]|nr:recombination protein RecR [Elusimicrobiota bacterium]